MFLVILILFSSLSLGISQANSAWQPNPPLEQNHSSQYDLPANFSYINVTDSNLLQVPNNHTFTQASMKISDFWNDKLIDSSQINFSANYTDQSLSSNYSIFNNGESLQLMADNASNFIEDFEIISSVPSDGWIPTGGNNSIWSIHENNVTINSQSMMNLPSKGYQDTGFLSTTGFGDLSPSTHSCLRSPKIMIPKTINNYTLTFYHWLALSNSDAVWIEYLDGNHSWSKIDVQADGIAAQSLAMVSGQVWNGNYQDWNFVNITLDNLFSPNQQSTYFKYCLETNSLIGLRGGVFLDQWILSNQGINDGAWFHGNLSGDYLSRSYSNLIIPVNFSALPQTDEIEVIMNWDMEGYLYDYLIVEFSDDNGSTWSSISGNFGIPGTGVQYNGHVFNSESFGWIPIFMSLNLNPSIQAGLLKFSARSNFQINYGGDSSSGWEGIAIDELTLHHSRGTQSHQKVLYNNFSTAPNIGLGSSDGWLLNTSATPNQWQWTNTLGVNGPEKIIFNFDIGQNVSHGWSIFSQSRDIWQQGQLPSNINVGGPSSWPSGSNGLAVGLNGNYLSETFTHLYSPEYYIPPKSTSRLSFMSWACTEENWDGGTVYVSNNSGLNWWILPAKINDFHDQISNNNSNSPFFGHGVIDGSSTIGGCQNSTRQFDYKTYDVSNLSGQEIRFRYSFFSDQWVEMDGWYIDDAGIKIDIFNNSAHWTSDLIYPNSINGWGLLDGFISEPNGTNVRFTILDGLTNQPIPNYINRTLPINLIFDSQQYQSIKIQVYMSTNNNYITPKVTSLSIGAESYFDAYHLIHGDYDISNIIISEDEQLSSKGVELISISHPNTCPKASAKITTFGDLVSLDSFSHPISSTDPLYNHTTYHNSIDQMIYLNDTVNLKLNQTSSLKQYRFTPYCADSSSNVSIKIGLNEDQIFSYSDQNLISKLGTSTIFSDVKLDGLPTSINNYTNIQLDVLDGQTATFSYPILLTEIQPHNDISFSVDIEVDSNEEVEIFTDNGDQILFPSGGGDINYIEFDSCNEKTFTNGLLSKNAGIAICDFNFQFLGNLSLRISNFIAISPVNELNISIPVNLLNSVKQETFQSIGQNHVTIPTFTSTAYGGLEVSFSSISYLHLVDRIINISDTRWLPNTSLSISSSHVRFDPISMSAADYSLSSIKLTASTSLDYADSLFEVEVIDLYQNPRFNQISGFNNVILNEDDCNIICHDGYCEINWHITSKWQMDDVDNVYWLISATDTDGLNTGPDVLLRESMYNEVENDLEIIDLSAIDHRGNTISHWFDPEWPFAIDNNKEISVHGKVRFEGAAGFYVSKGDAEIEVKLTAVPPKNASGGPDEWAFEPIIWQNSWYCEVGDNGQFNVNITTPDFNEIPSNVTLRLDAVISRLGPQDQIITTSNDFTSDLISTIFIFDTDSPKITSVEIFDPFGLVNADNHIWTLNQDIPVKVKISDVEALGTELIIWSWSEYTDDLNQDGVMDAFEYRKSTASINFASINAEIDLPAFSWQEIKGPYNSGKLSIVFQLQDLANNELMNGGDFGEENDSVTIYVEDQFNTFIDISSINLDLFDNELLPNYQHTFEFSLTDYNGINSLDRIQFSLINQNVNENCYIEYIPIYAITEYDQLCFDFPPQVKINKQSNLLKWDISIVFSINWSVMSGAGIDGGIPSLKIFDEGSDLNLGTSNIKGLSWKPNLLVNRTDPVLNDQTAPFGDSNSSIIWASPGDEVFISIPFMHSQTSILVTNFSSQTMASCTTLIDDDKVTIIDFNISDGLLNCHLSISPTIDKSKITVQLNLIFNPHFDLETIIEIEIDAINPYLDLDYSKILKLRSDIIENISITGQVMEQTSINDLDIVVNWYFVDKDDNVMTETFNRSLPLTQISNLSYSFDSKLNLLNGEINLSMVDSLIIWLEYFDNAGLELLGYGSPKDPLIAQLSIVEFSPEINSITPQNEAIVSGENFVLNVILFNTGLQDGTVDVLVSDSDGNALQITPVYIGPIDFVQQEFTIEAWKSGELELVISLVNFSSSQNIMIKDVDNSASSSNELMGTFGLVVILVILLAGGFGYFYHQNAVRFQKYRKHHLEQIRIKKRLNEEASSKQIISSEE